MSNITPETISTIEAGVDTMCSRTRQGFVDGLGRIVSLLPENENITRIYDDITEALGDPAVYIDQLSIRIGASACLELAVSADDSTPLGVYVARFSANHCYGSIPRKLAKMVISDAHQYALVARDRTRAEKVYRVGSSTRLLFPSDRVFEAVSRLSQRVHSS